MTTPVLRPRGKPTLLNPTTHKRVIDAVSAGLTWKDAAAYANVGYRTIFDWKLWGEHAYREVEEVLAGLDEETRDAIELLDDERRVNEQGQQDLAVPSARDLAIEAYVDERLRPYYRLFRAIERAQGFNIARNVGLIQEAGTGYTVEETTTVTRQDADGRVLETTTTTKRRRDRAWQASAWLLERRFPEQFAQVSRHEHSGLGGGAIELEHTVTEELQRLDPATRDARTAEILRIMADADVVDAEVVGELVVVSPNGERGATGSTGDGDDPEADEVHPAGPDA